MFKNMRKQKELIDREIELYKKEKLFAVDKEVEDYRTKRQQEMTDMAKKCYEQLGEYEHEFHNTKEIRGIELAKLQSKCEALAETVKAREEVVAADNNLLKAKTAEIERLNNIIKLMIEKQPSITVQSIK
ncbi:MAG: hypothetical protein AABY15_05830 [Nanoarchaeota archaeon]